MRVKARLLAAAATSTLILPGLAWAQDEGVVVEEVIVTAQKQAQNIQDVPIAISAFTARTLEERQVSDVAQLSNLAPNVTFDAGTPFSGSSNTLSAYIRGIGQNDFAFNLDPGVGVYVDGVYLARTTGANADLGDVERIEVLKGPQGTLFGRNTIGGAINVVTREPGREFAFDGTVTTGRFDRLDIKGSVDLPFSEALRATVSFSTKNRDGYLHRIPFNGGAVGVVDGPQNLRLADYETSDTEGGQDEWTLRGKLVFDGVENVKLTLTGDYAKVDQPGFANTLLATPNLPILPFGPTAGNFSAIYNTCINSTPAQLAAPIPAPFPPFSTNLSVVCGSRGVPFQATRNPLGSANATSSIAGVNVDADPSNNRLPFDSRFLTGDIDTSYATGISFSKLDTWGVSGVVDVALSDNMSLKSITAYRTLEFLSGLDLDGSPLEMLSVSFLMNQEQISQELQLTGKAFDNRLSYVFGAYYFNEDGDLHDLVPFPAGLLQVDGFNTFDTTAWAGFAHLNFAVTDRFSVTLGGRYTRETKRFEGGQSDLNGFNYRIGGIPVDLLIGIPCDAAGPLPPSDMCDFAALVGFPDTTGNVLRYHPPGEFKRTFTDFSPRIGLEFKPTDRVMVYASYSQGFKSGGWTTRYSNPVPRSQAEPGFRPETADSYEAGVKSELFDRRLRLNAAAFYSEYKNIQLNQQEGVSPTLRNAGDAEIKGIEVEALASLSRAFSVSASLGFTDADYTRIAAGVNAGSRLPKTARWQFNLAPRYELELSGGASVLLLADYTHTSPLYNDTENTPELRRGAVDMLNASATYRHADGRWEAGLGVSNILDERYLVTGSANLASGQIYGTYSRPVEWYASLRVKF